ncbi:hypothetical protein BpHYR1_035289 [Brachionus plicatilis]|uniref:Uncharacterized protein n=1 Tax=Brachionus plicatilis TaxID=10195 RepID=A0A3M7P841_BRAPC|nr:hypothetical protein BpHYR1_035289 [Brachionus plicatilis]
MYVMFTLVPLGPSIRSPSLDVLEHFPTCKQKPNEAYYINFLNYPLLFRPIFIKYTPLNWINFNINLSMLPQIYFNWGREHEKKLMKLVLIHRSSLTEVFRSEISLTNTMYCLQEWQQVTAFFLMCQRPCFLLSEFYAQFHGIYMLANRQYIHTCHHLSRYQAAYTLDWAESLSHWALRAFLWEF